MLRTTHGIEWSDDLAWMEEMSGPRWNTFIKGHQDRWKKTVDSVSEEIPLITSELKAAFETPHAMMFGTSGRQIEIGVTGMFGIKWKFHRNDGGELRDSADLEAKRGGLVWTVDEIGEGGEVYALRHWRREGAGSGSVKKIWEHRGTSPSLALLGSRCFSLECKNKLIYWRLVSWDAATGADFRVHYEEKDPRYNLELLRSSKDTAILRRQSGPKQDCFWISETGRLKGFPEGVSEASRRYIFGSEKDEWIIWSDGTWRPSPALANRWRLPVFGTEHPEILKTSQGILVTKCRGERTIWRLQRNAAPFTVWKGYGQVLPDAWDSPWVRIMSAGSPEAVWWNCEEEKRPPVASHGWRSVVRKDAKGVADGTPVPYILIQPIVNTGATPAGLLVVGYGAYGLSTPLMTSRWEPLLKRGWAIAIGLYRGGGDDSPEWEDAGRCLGRPRTLADAEAVVRAARRETGVPAKKTVLFGRSAGGLWVGGLVAKYPDGSLAGGAYMEVPYLDALRTMTNPDLPLTLLETDEFGLPAKNLPDFITAFRWSPMELLRGGKKKVRGVWQIVRTGLNDSEVFAYESAKWVERSGEKANFVVEGGQGHFVYGDVGFQQEAEDLSVILNKKSQE